MDRLFGWLEEYQRIHSLFAVILECKLYEHSNAMINRLFS